MFHLNCRSLLANFDNINVLLTSLTLEFDIITFSETWLTDKTTKFLANALPDYKLYTVCRNTAGGSVAAYVNKDFTVSELHVTSTTSFEHLDLLLNIPSCSNIILSVIYRALNTSLTDSNRDFITYIDQLEALHINKHEQYILAGDYNIDLLHYEINQINQFLNIM